jgi:8-oxo-dGTP pyrophosphatase MutT (NUDIX family)
MTVSAWIFKNVGEKTSVFVHMHRKMHKYMEVGGHMELDETPWQTIAHELLEEAGYTLDELDIYQPSYMPVALKTTIVHPVPLLVVTYQPLPGHYHTDLVYGFHAKAEPRHSPAGGESQELRWMTFKELRDGASTGEVLSDVEEIYLALRDAVVSQGCKRVATNSFSLDKPQLNMEAIEGMPKNE